jgi:signal transduction histidine kinase
MEHDESFLFTDRQIAVFSPPDSTHERFCFVQAFDGKKQYRLIVMYSVKAIQGLADVGSNLIGKSGDLFVLDHQGFFITQPRLINPQQQGIQETNPALHQCLKEGNSDRLDIDQRSVKIILSFRHIPEIGGGCVMAHLDQAEAFADLYALQWRLGMTTLGLIGLAFIIALLVGRRITKPIDKLREVTHQIIDGNYAVSAVVTGDTEIVALATAFNLMAKRLQAAFDEVHQQQSHLEEQVAMRTEELLNAKEHAEESLTLLQQTQENLIQAEKMAALGGLVAGVAHEINTPVGITLSSATFLQAETEKVFALYQEGELDGDGLDSYFDTAQQSAKLMAINCQRAAALIQSFKQVAVDQTSDNQRQFNLKEYLAEIVLSLRPAIKKSNVVVHLNCPEEWIVSGYPGALSQIVTNFVMNSLTHAYDTNQTKQGIIMISVNKRANHDIELIYSDDGKGISKEIQSKVFDPFFTTQRSNGGSGLGLHLVYNIVHQTLKGTLQMSSTENLGTTFTIVFPELP